MVQTEIAKSLQDAASKQQAGDLQAGREAIQLAYIELARLKSVGQMKGSPWDPLPGNPMHFSDLMQLAGEERVQFLDYGDHGQHVAGWASTSHFLGGLVGARWQNEMG